MEDLFRYRVVSYAYVPVDGRSHEVFLTDTCKVYRCLAEALVRDDASCGCGGCDFRMMYSCHGCPCTERNREDGRSVVFRITGISEVAGFLG